MVHLVKMVSNCYMNVERTFNTTFSGDYSAGKSPGLNAYQECTEKVKLHTYHINMT